ncbi:MAG TPA: trypsin-like peptidase domain-containing protein [Candidatus Acidoferrales bacterium]|nr:trypsin-like peptidase domain-containing protein [Candidatus Acidoferrales bacterium]
MRILLLNLTADSRQAVDRALAGQGYETAIESGLTVEEVLTLSPEVLITEATPSDLSCCGVVSQLKSQPEAGSPLKVLMIVRGEALERARALDLGADDVISFPFDELEFAAKVRTQFRERRPEQELKTMLKAAEQREHLAELAAESLSGSMPGRRRFWLIPALVALSAATILAAVFIGISARNNRKDALQLRAEIVRLSKSQGLEAELLNRTQQARGSLEQNSRSTSATRDSLQSQSEQLRRAVATSGASESDSLKKQLVDTQTRLNLLEKEGKFAETVVRKYGPSVCLLHVVVEFQDRQSHRPIRIVVDTNGKPVVDDKGMAQLTVDGDGPPLQIDVFGTGFLVSRDGTILTNHHVVEPWWADDELKQLLAHGVDPVASAYNAYFPGQTVAIQGKVGRISQAADVATLKLQAPAPAQAQILELDDRKEASVTGDPVVLIGYPTAIEGILARTDSEIAQKILSGTQNVSQLVSQIASRELIRPTTTQGHIGDVLIDKIVYDAATTSGGSGGPLFNRDGRVIGINFAVIKDFGGSNLAVPARYAQDLLK